MRWWTLREDREGAGAGAAPADARATDPRQCRGGRQAEAPLLPCRRCTAAPWRHPPHAQPSRIGLGQLPARLAEPASATHMPLMDTSALEGTGKLQLLKCICTSLSGA